MPRAPAGCPIPVRQLPKTSELHSSPLKAIPSVGNDQLDHQHQRLIALCQRAEILASDESLPPDDFVVVLNDIMEQIVQHFTDEEALLARNACPSLEAHRAEHTRFLEVLTDTLLHSLESQHDRVGLARTMGLWINEHLRQFDLPATKYLCS